MLQPQRRCQRVEGDVRHLRVALPGQHRHQEFHLAALALDLTL